MLRPPPGLSKTVTITHKTVSVAMRVHTERPELPAIAMLAKITEQPPTQNRFCVQSTEAHLTGFEPIDQFVRGKLNGPERRRN